MKICNACTITFNNQHEVNLIKQDKQTLFTVIMKIEKLLYI